MFLIVNGDDFGFSHGVNEGIIKAHTKGILTSTSLMVSGDAFEEAVNLAKNHSKLGIGLHLVLCCGKSVLSPEEIPHLVDKNGNFSDSPFLAGLNYQFNADARRELKLEIRAQLQRFKHTGLTMSHVDGHLHLHTHPVVLNYLVEFAPEFDIKFIRLPLEELDINLRINPDNKLMKIVYYWVFGQLRKYGDRLLSAHNIRFSDRVYGLLETAKMNEDYLLKLIPNLAGKIVEIYSHPAITIEGEPINGNPGSGEVELQAYLSDQVRDLIINQGWNLTNYHGL